MHLPVLNGDRREPRRLRAFPNPTATDGPERKASEASPRLLSVIPLRCGDGLVNMVAFVVCLVITIQAGSPPVTWSEHSPRAKRPIEAHIADYERRLSRWDDMARTRRTSRSASAAR